MPVQMIELEEVQMVEVSDDALEAADNVAMVWSSGTCYQPPAC